MSASVCVREAIGQWARLVNTIRSKSLKQKYYSMGYTEVWGSVNLFIFNGQSLDPYEF